VVGWLETRKAGRRSQETGRRQHVKYTALVNTVQTNRPPSKEGVVPAKMLEYHVPLCSGKCWNWQTGMT
jgi:hypothetical protein